MLERSSPPCLEDLPSAAGGFVCPTGAPPQLLLDEASAHFVRLRSRIEPHDDDHLARWLERSPCHRCAWHRVGRAWDLLGKAPRPA